MGNPVYKDVKKAKAWENFFLHEISMLFDLNILWNPDRFIIDWSATKKPPEKGRPEIIRFIEAKVRKDHSVHKWDDFMVGLRKYKWGIEYENVSGIPFVLAFRMSDAIVTYKNKPEHDNKILFSGRSYNKRWDGDVTPCIHIKKEYCKIHSVPYTVPPNMIEDLNNSHWEDIQDRALLFLDKHYENKKFINYDNGK